VHLEPQAFDLLVYLIEHRDRVVPKNELLDGVWGHGYLSETNLTTRIKEARRAIGDDGSAQHAIRTVRGRGYRFVAPVEIVGLRWAPGLGSGLIGRDKALRVIVDSVGQSPLSTLTGPGGVGKSTLAQATVAKLGNLYADGGHVVELAALADGASVLPATARALDVAFDGRRPDDAVRSIARLDALLVLDNCEHVIDEVAVLVDGMLRFAEARLRVLATSQVRLGLSTEAVIAVGPLSVSAAGELFAERARAVLPSWDLDAIGRDRVDQLVSRLDCLPLTIEMAAARLGSMALADLEHAIDDGRPLLQITHRSPVRHHRSLESVVDWSARLLEPNLRQWFIGFSVFAGRLRASDAAAVLSPDDRAPALFGLASLAERSLLVTDLEEPDTRYSMLTTVRAVAAEWLDESGVANDLHQRHAEYFRHVLREIDDQLRTPREADGRRRLASVVDEVRAAHRWAQRDHPQLASEMNAALFHASHTSLWLEPAEWGRALLARHAPGDAATLHGAMVASAGAASHRGDLDLAREQASFVAVAATGRVLAIAFELLADIALYQGDLEEVTRAAEELGRLGQELGDSHASALSAIDAALARSYGGDPVGALDALACVDPGELSPTDGAWLAYARGDALTIVRDPAAVAAFHTAIDLGTTVGNWFVISVARTSLASELTRAGDALGALDAFADALAGFLRHGNHTHAVTAMRNLIELLETLGDDRGATMLGAATSQDGLRLSYGAEADRISKVLEVVEQRVGTDRYSRWFAEGRALDPDQALRTAARIVDEHRG